ncbi:uncharacterized protein LOC119159166 [Falco rusticolus]|uniref:uncharacterized protein LOC119159166 n=1 Tax=Falco rusticolus TaxID=120794 RepID=UPI0018868AED|nr:uncharacterized protein LOC119159166 [Falco rusticolus]
MRWGGNPTAAGFGAGYLTRRWAPRSRVYRAPGRGGNQVWPHECALKLPELPRCRWWHLQHLHRRAGQGELLGGAQGWQIPSPSPARGRAGAAKRAGIAWAAGISAGTNPAAPYQMLPPCLRSLRQPSWVQLVLSGPLSPRLDASQWISMSHSNAEKLMIKKDFSLCIIPHLRLLSTPSPRAQAAQPQPGGLVMLGDAGRCWVMLGDAGAASLAPVGGWETKGPLFFGPGGGAGTLHPGCWWWWAQGGLQDPGCPAPRYRLQPQHPQRQDFNKKHIMLPRASAAERFPAGRHCCRPWVQRPPTAPPARGLRGGFSGDTPPPPAAPQAAQRVPSP